MLHHLLPNFEGPHEEVRCFYMGVVRSMFLYGPWRVPPVSQVSAAVDDHTDRTGVLHDLAQGGEYPGGISTLRHSGRHRHYGLRSNVFKSH